MKRRWLICLLVALCGLIPRGLGAAAPAPAVAGKTPAGGTNLVAATNAPALAAQEAEADPVARPGDKLSLRIKEDPYGDVPETQIVSPSGRAEFRVSRKYKQTVALEVGGKPLSEVKRLLKQKLDADYYANATLEMSLASAFASTRVGKVMIYGDGVKNQIVNLVPGEEKRILEVILNAGTSEFSQLKKVKLLRLNPKTNTIETQLVNIEEMKKTGNEEKNILLQDGDKILIPERGIVW